MSDTITTDLGNKVTLTDVNEQAQDTEAFDMDSDTLWLSKGGKKMKKASPSALAKAFMEKYASSMLGGKNQSIQSAIAEIASNTQANQDDIALLSETVNTKLAEINALIATKFDNAYLENGYQYFESDGEVVCGPLGPFAGGGNNGASSGNNAVLTVTNSTGWLSATLAYGAECSVSLNWSSLEDGLSTGSGTVRVTANGTLRSLLSVNQGDVTVNLTDYLASGTNTVRVNVSDVYGNNRTINFTIQCVELSISSTFDETVIYSSAFTFPYTPVGAVTKTIHILVDGTEIETVSTAVSARQLTYVIPAQTHGAHEIECYFDATVNGEKVESNHLKYEIIYVVSGNITPIITSSFKDNTVLQYTTMNIGYMVYDPSQLTTPVVITVNGTEMASLTVDRTQQTFAYRPVTADDLTIVFTSGAASKTIKVAVTELSINAMAETDSLVLHMTSAGRSNSEEDPSIWQDTINNISAALTDFNYASDGWTIDSDGVTALRVSGDARVTIPYQIFAEDFRTSGKTIELEFATRDVMNYDAVILSSVSGGIGLTVTPQLATLKSEQSTISMQYKEDEHVRLSFVIEKRSENRVIYVYVNGIASGSVQYPAADDFSQASPVGISIGSNECTTDIYCIRVYDNDLTRNQILDNWIADTQDVDEMLDRYNRNNVYDAYGNIVISQLPNYLPYMIITAPELPQYKGDKKTVEIAYTDPLTPANSFSASGVQIDVQGTSSAGYARKNYKPKFKNGFTMTESAETVSTYKLRSDSIGESTFCLKADVASSEGANNVELVRLYNETCPYKTPAQEENSAVRQGIDGFPIVIFWDNGAETTFLGKYNFNNDKSDETTFGFKSGDESWEVLNNTSQRTLYKSADFSGTDWLNDFEARYPDEDPAYTDNTQLAAFSAWIVQTDTTAATDAALSSAVTYDGTEYTTDSKEYRLAKFKAELGNYVELESAEFYYLFTEMFLMVDSRAKNMFPSFMGSEVSA